jgi:pilus biogenesis lipoprotein CpaD
MSFTRILPFIAALALAGCGVTSNHEFTVGHEMASHTVLFAPGQSELDAAENDALDEFLASLSPSAIRDLSLEGGEADELTDMRLSAVSAALRMRGFPSNIVLFTGNEELESDAMRLDITYAVATPDAHCPDWTRPGANYLNSMHTNYGCAYNKNLAAMVANPEDLERGHGTNTVSGDRNVLVIKRYRAGLDIAAPVAGASTTATPTSSTGSNANGTSSNSSGGSNSESAR